MSIDISPETAALALTSFVGLLFQATVISNNDVTVYMNEWIAAVGLIAMILAFAISFAILAGVFINGIDA